MLPQKFPSRGCIAIASLFALLLSLSGCGNSSSVNVSAPSTLNRCGVSVATPGSVVPASGGTGTLTVSAQRECGWSARAEATWISLNTSEGQGPATLTYAVVANPNGSSRRGSVMVEQQRVEIVQEAAPCRFEVSPSAAELDGAGGVVDIALAGPGGCPWTAQSTGDWLSAQPGSGTGAATIRISVLPNPGAARTADLRIGGINVPVRQAAAGAAVPPGTPPPGTPPAPAPGACAYEVAPARKTSGAAGETFTATVTTTASCQWTAESEVSWIDVARGAAGTGAGAVQLEVRANSGSARTGAVRIAGRLVTVEQEAVRSSCSYTISPTGRSIGRDATDVAVDVRSANGCGWSSTSQASWITVREGAAGSGNGEVRLSVAANTGSARSGTATIAGTSFTIQQEGAAACTYSIKPDYYNAGRGRDEVLVGVTAPGGCPWTATSDAGWVTVADGRSGSGAGNVRLVVDANSGAARSTTLTIAGQAFRLSQEGAVPCTYSIKPDYYNAGRGRDEIIVGVTAPGGCAWTATSGVGWVTVADGRSGSGSGNVRLVVDANSGAPRSTTLTIAGHDFRLTQEGACEATIKPTYYNAGSGPDNVTIDVKVSGGCEWTATSPVSWATIAEVKSGPSGEVRVHLERNTGEARSATLTIAGVPFALTQEGPRK